LRSMQARFQDVLNLRPPKSIFKWTSVSKLPMEQLETSGKTIKDRARAAKLESPPSPAERENLMNAFINFRDAYRNFRYRKSTSSMNTILMKMKPAH
jgi:hypothetical protein